MHDSSVADSGRLCITLQETPSGHLLDSVIYIKKWRLPNIHSLIEAVAAFGTQPATLLYCSNLGSSKETPSSSALAKNVGTSSGKDPTASAAGGTSRTNQSSSGKMVSTKRLNVLRVCVCARRQQHSCCCHDDATSEQHNTITRDRWTGDGTAAILQCWQSGTRRSSVMSTRRPSTEAEEQQPSRLNMCSMRKSLAGERVYTTCSTWRGGDADRTLSAVTLQIFHASAVTALCDFGVATRDSETAGAVYSLLGWQLRLRRIWTTMRTWSSYQS
eukprot:5170347-Amphidinium_carterae.3